MKFLVSYMCIYSEEVEAETKEEAEDIVAWNCPLDIDGEPCTILLEEEEEE